MPRCIRCLFVSALHDRIRYFWLEGCGVFFKGMSDSVFSQMLEGQSTFPQILQRLFKNRQNVKLPHWMDYSDSQYNCTRCSRSLSGSSRSKV